MTEDPVLDNGAMIWRASGSSKEPVDVLICWLGSFEVREHTVNAVTEPKLEAGPERRPGVRAERQYCLRRMEAKKIPLTVPILGSVRVRVFGCYNRLQILREVPRGGIDGLRRERRSVVGSYRSHREPNHLGAEFGPKTRASA